MRMTNDRLTVTASASRTSTDGATEAIVALGDLLTVRGRTKPVKPNAASSRNPSRGER
jgi:hypothetical protein